MGKSLIIKGANFYANAIAQGDFLYLTQDEILSGHAYYIKNNRTQFGANTSQYKGGFIDITTHTNYDSIIVKKKASRDLARIAFLKQLPTESGQTVVYATGYSDFITINNDDNNKYSIPSDCAYIYVMYYNIDAGGDIFPNTLALMATDS